MYCSFTKKNKKVIIWAKSPIQEKAFALGEIAVLEAFGSRDPQFETTINALEAATESEVEKLQSFSDVTPSLGVYSPLCR